MAPVICRNPGCGVTFDPSSASDCAPGLCTYHPGTPVFHEGLKSWSCCNDQTGHRPVLAFEDFMGIKGCTQGSHSSEKKVTTDPSSSSTDKTKAEQSAGPVTTSKDGVETYGISSTTSDLSSITLSQPSASAPQGANAKSTAAPTLPPSTHWLVPHDPPTASVPAGAQCKRRGCSAVWKGADGAKRTEGNDGFLKDGFEAQSGMEKMEKLPTSASAEKEEDETTPKASEGQERDCRFHPGNPIFHEGSKGYLCCKPRVLDFDDFLKIPGCRTSFHLFVGRPEEETSAANPENVDCRVDHYQTPTQVHVSAFAKNADKEKSKVVFETQAIHLDFYLPANKRVSKTIELYGPIDPAKSVFKVLGTKVDITLAKPSPTSWPVLAKPSNPDALPPGYALTFGVSGRTGTVGGKEIVMEQGKRL